MNASGKDFLHLHFIILIWGFTAILGKLISIPSVELVFYRTLIASIGIGTIALIYKKQLKTDLKQIIQLLLVGMLVSAHWILFFLSARVSNVSVCLVGIATTAFWTSLIEPLISRRKVIWLEVVLGLLVILGLYIIFMYEFEVASGLILAIISAIFASIFTIINSKMAKKTNHYAIAFYEMSGANLGILLFFPLYISYFSESNGLQLGLQSMDIIYLLVLSLVCTVYAYTASIHLMKKFSAFAINLSINLEPVYGIVLAFIIFHEHKMMNAPFFIGAMLIILSIILYPVLNKYYAKKAVLLNK